MKFIRSNHICLLSGILKFIFLTSLISCGYKQTTDTIREGDILFQDLNCGELCDAIETVTEGYEGRKFSHCGLVIKQGDSLMILEAIGEKVQLSTLEKFAKRSGDTAEIKNLLLGRLKPAYTHIIPKAIRFATAEIGKPYDDAFIMSNGRWYCSELLYEAFSVDGDTVFSLEPMTFKDPATKKFFPAWVEYYENLKTPIPEGMPGINPGLMSRSEKLDIIHIGNLR
jgi:hypothetical protein